MDQALRSRFESALAGFPAEPALVSLVRTLVAEGMSQRDVFDRFEEMRGILNAEGRDFDEDAVMGVMDRIVGFCAPAARLFPTRLEM